MATPRRPYASLRLGLIDDVMRSGVSPNGALLLVLIMTHRLKRSIPGLLTLGPAGLAESLSAVSDDAAREGVSELERMGLVMVDAQTRPPLLYVRGAVEADPPSTANACIGMAKQLRSLPASPITRVVSDAVTACLSDSQHLSLWLAESAAVAVDPGPGPESMPDSIPEPGRSQSEPSSDPEPEPEPGRKTTLSQGLNQTLNHALSGSGSEDRRPLPKDKSTAAPFQSQERENEATGPMLDRLFYEAWKNEATTTDRVAAIKELLAARGMTATVEAINASERRVDHKVRSIVKRFQSQDRNGASEGEFTQVGRLL